MSSLRVRGCTQQQKNSVARISSSITTVPISIPQISVGRPQIDFAAVASIGYIRAVSVTDCWYSPVVVLSSSTSSGHHGSKAKLNGLSTSVCCCRGSFVYIIPGTNWVQWRKTSLLLGPLCNGFLYHFLFSSFVFPPVPRKTNNSFPRGLSLDLPDTQHNNTTQTDTHAVHIMSNAHGHTQPTYTTSFTSLRTHTRATQKGCHLTAAKKWPFSRFHFPTRNPTR